MVLAHFPGAEAEGNGHGAASLANRSARESCRAKLADCVGVTLRLGTCPAAVYSTASELAELTSDALCRVSSPFRESSRQDPRSPLLRQEQRHAWPRAPSIDECDSPRARLRDLEPSSPATPRRLGRRREASDTLFPSSPLSAFAESS